MLINQDEQWIIWNGSLGILDRVTIGEIESESSGRNAWLEEPYDMVGPFCLEELETSGQIRFAECMVMSIEKWQENNAELRRESLQKRREAQQRVYERQARYNARFHQAESEVPSQYQRHQEQQHRAVLNLPMEGVLEPAQIKAAFRRLAQKVHPDMGGSDDHFVQIAQARNALLDS